MKGKLAKIALLLAGISLFTACGTAKSASNGSGSDVNRLQAIKDRGYIEVATEPYFAPNEFIDSSKEGDDKYVGSDIELAKYIADKLQVELRIVPLEFAAVLGSITEGKYDLAISALAYTPAREEAMNLSKGYHFEDDSEGYGLLVRNEDAAKYPDAKSLENAVVVGQSGSLQELFITKQIPKYKEFKRVSSTTDGFLMVKEGKADAAATAIGTAKLYVQANPGVTIADTFKFSEDDTTKGTRIGIPKGETELTEKINEIIDEVVESGQYKKWYDEYSDYAAKLGVK